MRGVVLRCRTIPEAAMSYGWLRGLPYRNSHDHCDPKHACALGIAHACYGL